MREPSERQKVGASPALSVLEDGPAGIETAADLAERAGAQFVLLDDLRRSSATAAELASAERMLAGLLRDLRRRSPEGPESFLHRPRLLPLHGDTLGEISRRSQTAPQWMGRMGRALIPLQMELLRPQYNFNRALAKLLVELEILGGGVDPEGTQNLIRRTLEPLADPALWRHESHRTGPTAMVVGLVKRSGVAVLLPLLRLALERMQAWNRLAINVLLTAASDSLPTRADSQKLVRSLEAAADPCPPGTDMPQLLRELLVPQRRFAFEATRVLARYLAILPPVTDEEYRQWCGAFEPTRVKASTLALRQLRSPPAFSVVLGAREVEPGYWRECVASLRNQNYELWELCIGGPRHELEYLRGHLPPEWASDSRLRFIPAADSEGQAGALNAAARAARGAILAFVDPTDQLAPHALAEMALALTAHPQAQLVYSDEDRLDGTGHRHRPFFKPDWSRDMQRACDYTTRLLVMRRQAFEKLGGVREGFDGAELFDLVLRASESSAQVAHVPAVLYHRRQTSRANHFVNASAHVALSQHLARCGEEAAVHVSHSGLLRVRHTVKGTPRVSIIVPFFDDKPERLQQLWRTFRAHTRWQDWQLILVSSHAADPKTHALLAELDDPRVLKLTWNQAFNASAVRNFAARHAKGELLLFLGSNLELVEDEWLEELIAQIQRPDVGLVGPLVLFPNGTIQNAGTILGPGGFSTHAFWKSRPDDETAFGRPDCPRDYLAVSGACLMLRREVFEQVGGFDERLIASGWDVELALRIAGRGLRCVYTPYARLVHHDATTMPKPPPPDRDVWLSYAAFRPWTRRGDPFYNPNLTFRTMDVSLRQDERSAEALAVQKLAWELPETLSLIGPG